VFWAAWVAAAAAVLIVLGVGLVALRGRDNAIVPPSWTARADRIAETVGILASCRNRTIRRERSGGCGGRGTPVSGPTAADPEGMQEDNGVTDESLLNPLEVNPPTGLSWRSTSAGHS